MSYILPPNIFPPTTKPYDSRTVADSPLITTVRPKTVSATESPRPAEAPSVYSKPFTTIAPQETESAREAPLAYPQPKAIKTLTISETEAVSDYVKQP